MDWYVHCPADVVLLSVILIRVLYLGVIMINAVQQIVIPVNVAAPRFATYGVTLF
jgi:hypothetical protein